MSPTGKTILSELARQDSGIDGLQTRLRHVHRTIIEATLASLKRHGYTTDHLYQGRAVYVLTDKGREFVESRMESITPGKLHVNSMMRNAVPSDFPRMPTPTRLMGVAS